MSDKSQSTIEKHCLKCGADSKVLDDSLVECPKCGAIYLRVEEAIARKAAEEAERDAVKRAQAEKIEAANNKAAGSSAALIALQACPACQKTISSAAAACPHCGHPMAPPKHFAGPPRCCSNCGGALRSESKSTNSGSGCLIILVGLLFSPFLIGIPVVLYGMNLMQKREGIWRCKKCESTFPRRIRWYEIG